MGSYIFTGGILYGLLSETRKTKGRASRMTSSYADDTCDNTTLLIKLGAIIGPEFSHAISKNTASRYKQCQGQGGLEFNTQAFKDKMMNEIENNYEATLNRTKVFINECLTSDENIRFNFVKQCHYILKSSTFINDNRIKLAYHQNANKFISVKAFADVEDYDFPSFLLAIIVLVLGTYTNNSLGQSTFENLFTKDNNTSEYLLNKIPLSNSIKVHNLVFDTPPSDKCAYIIDDKNVNAEIDEDIKKDSPNHIDEPEVEIIEAEEAEEAKPKDSTNKSQRIINISGNGKYFEHIDTLILKDDD